MSLNIYLYDKTILARKFCKMMQNLSKGYEKLMNNNNPRYFTKTYKLAKMHKRYF